VAMRWILNQERHKSGSGLRSKAEFQKARELLKSLRERVGNSQEIQFAASTIDRIELLENETYCETSRKRCCGLYSRLYRSAADWACLWNIMGRTSTGLREFSRAPQLRGLLIEEQKGLCAYTGVGLMAG